MRTLGDTALFYCAGRFVSCDIECLQNAIRAHAHARRVVLDLAGIRSIDAAGMSVLVSLREWADTTGTALKLMNLTPSVEDVLELTQLRSAFSVCSVREMLELLCRAIRQARSEAAYITEINRQITEPSPARNEMVAAGNAA